MDMERVAVVVVVGITTLVNKKNKLRALELSLSLCAAINLTRDEPNVCVARIELATATAACTIQVFGARQFERKPETESPEASSVSRLRQSMNRSIH